MKIKIILVTCLAVTLACVATRIFLARRPVTQLGESDVTTQVRPAPASVPELPATPAVKQLPPPEVTPSSQSEPTLELVKTEKPRKSDDPTNAIPQAAALQPQPAPPPQDEIRDPLAREAMALVGVDPDAEEYWFEAINDPTLADNEREDLIEDLNENGYSGGDGSRATVEDLPLIARRIDIVEALWPFAMDQNNWKAFQEVSKDLWNMYARLNDSIFPSAQGTQPGR